MASKKNNQNIVSQFEEVLLPKDEKISINSRKISVYSFSELVDKLTEKEMLEHHSSFRYKNKRDTFFSD